MSLTPKISIALILIILIGVVIATLVKPSSNIKKNDIWKHYDKDNIKLTYTKITIEGCDFLYVYPSNATAQNDMLVPIGTCVVPEKPVK